MERRHREGIENAKKDLPRTRFSVKINGIAGINIIACCFSLLLSNTCFAEVKIRLQFGSEIFVPKVAPEFSCRNANTRQSFLCELIPTNNSGEYILNNLAAGNHSILVVADENQSNPKDMPGDWRGYYRFTSDSSNSTQIFNVPMFKVIHMVKPQSNDGDMPGVLGRNCMVKPLFMPTGNSWASEMVIPFEWDPVVNGATYKIKIVRKSCGVYKNKGVLRQLETRETSSTISLPPNLDDEYYTFDISAFKDGHLVGDLRIYDSGMSSRVYGFRVGPTSAPTSYYVAAISMALILILLWFALRYLGVGLVTRLLIHLVLIAILVFTQKIFPNAKSYIPYKYFNAPPAFLANAKPPEIKSKQAQSNIAYPYSWEKEVSKPAWWDSVVVDYTIDSNGELSLWWVSHNQSESSKKTLFKAIYKAIANHPEDEQLAVTGMNLLFYLTDDQKILSQVGKVAIHYHFNHVRRINNCSGCKTADTITGIANSYAPILAKLQGPQKAISMLESIMDTHGGNINKYLTAELLVAQIEMLHQSKHMREAREKLDYALSLFSSDAGEMYLSRLRMFDYMIPKFVNYTYVCKHGNQKRKIQVVYKNTTSSVPCEVTYDKGSGAVSLWRAQNETGYCEEKAVTFIAKQNSWGWSCHKQRDKAN